MIIFFNEIVKNHRNRQNRGFVAFCYKIDFQGLRMAPSMDFLENLKTPVESPLKIL